MLTIVSGDCAVGSLTLYCLSVWANQHTRHHSKTAIAWRLMQVQEDVTDIHVHQRVQAPYHNAIGLYQVSSIIYPNKAQHCTPLRTFHHSHGQLTGHLSWVFVHMLYQPVVRTERYLTTPRVVCVCAVLYSANKTTDFW